MTEAQQEQITLDRKEFLDFLKWMGVEGELATGDNGDESFFIFGNAGDIFSLDVCNHQSEGERVRPEVSSQPQSERRITVCDVSIISGSCPVCPQYQTCRHPDKKELVNPPGERDMVLGEAIARLKEHLMWDIPHVMTFGIEHSIEALEKLRSKQGEQP